MSFKAVWPRVRNLAAGLVVFGIFSPPANSVSEGPRLVLWAWARNEDLRFIDPQHTGVAYLASTVQVNGGAVRVTRRRQSLLLPPATHLIAVAHFAASAPESGALRRAVEAVLELTQSPGLAGVQLDFEATPSQRFFYRELVRQIRQGLPTGQYFSATALASWCLFDRWLDGLPLDEVVPMAFSMGVGSAEVRARLARKEDFLPPYCRASVGVSLQEPLPTIPSPRRIYAFSARAWHLEDYQQLRAALTAEISR